jgi:hypothetical protein
MIANLVYSLCALTCWSCALLLLRGYWLRRSRILLWSGLAFCVFGVGNILLCVDLLFFPGIDMSLLRNLVTLAGIGLLLRALIWEGLT